MKLITITALALIAAVAATPATAQMQVAPPEPQQKQPQPQPQQQQPEQKITPSKGAMKAFSDLQTAVQKNDVANIPAKMAAAQAVATTKEDKYFLGRLKLQAALAAKDNAGMAAAVDLIASSNYLD